MYLLILLSAAMGLLLHSGALSGHFRGAGMFCYYTNLSNLLVALYALARLILPEHSPLDIFFARQIVEFSVFMGIFLTFLVYHFVLLPGFNRKHPGCWKSADNLLVHYVTPLLMSAQWVLFSPKSELNRLNILIWLILPLCYLLFAFLRAPFGTIDEGGHRYPYRFMDPDRIGAVQTARNLLALTLICCALSEVIFTFTAFIP